MLMSTTFAPAPSANRAASAIQRASRPAICTTWTGRPAPSAFRRISSMPVDQASDATISDTTMPAPPSQASRRNGTSVTPDMGARITRLR